MIGRSFVFQPGDVIQFADTSTGLWGLLKRWLLYEGEKVIWGHVSIFWGAATSTADELIMPWMAKDHNLIPLQVEAIDRGVLKTDLRNQRGRYIRVLRHPDFNVARKAVLKAGCFARQGKRWYDYWCILRYVFPYLLCRRLFDVTWGFGYKHNEKFICSEQADAAYSYTLFDDERSYPTLPGDYEYTILKPVAQGFL